MSCWKTPTEELEFPQAAPSTESYDYFDVCSKHGATVEFICLDAECRDRRDMLLCNTCVIDHQKHTWITKQEFLTPNIRKILNHGSPQSDARLAQALQMIEEGLDRLERSVTRQIAQMRGHFTESMSAIQEKYKLNALDNLESQRQLVDKVIVGPRVAEKLIRIHEIEQKNYEWIEVMQDSVLKITQEIEKSFNNLLQDLNNVLDAQKWENRDKFVDELKDFQKHLHNHDEQDSQYYLFSPQDKHINIAISRDQRDATYLRSIPSKPVAISRQYLSATRRRFGFQIIKMQSKAIFFETTTVFIGICNPQIAKLSGIRKINELGKGAYLISSAGWSYHSDDPQLCGKQIVGWGFSQGDKINVQLIFGLNSRIIFTKQNRFFSNRFEMNLGINEFQLQRMKPCVSFQAEQGAIVRLYDL